MRISYYPDTDSLYIDLLLSRAPTAVRCRMESFWIMTQMANLVGIDIDEASTKLEMRELILSKLPAQVTQVV